MFGPCDVITFRLFTLTTVRFNSVFHLLDECSNDVNVVVDCSDVKRRETVPCCSVEQ